MPKRKKKTPPRGVLFKDIEPDHLLALTDEVEMAGFNVEVAAGSALFPRERLAYFCYATGEQLAAVASRLPNRLTVAVQMPGGEPIIVRNAAGDGPLTKRLFSADAVREIFRLAGVTSPRKYYRIVAETGLNLVVCPE